MKVSDLIRQHIDNNGMRLNHVAKKSGIPVKRFYQLINGKTKLDVDEYNMICRQGLSVDPSLFLKKTSQ